MSRPEPPAFWLRAGVFAIGIFVAALVMGLLTGSDFAESLLIALVIGLPLGLLLARILPIRFRQGHISVGDRVDETPKSTQR